MPYIVADRVAELSTTEGVGAFALLGGVAGFRTFASAMAVADTCPYFIEALDANNVPSGAYEYGRGTYSALNTLTRTTVLGSSNAGAAVNFAAGNKLVSVGVLSADMLAKGNTAALTPFALTLLDDANAAAARATLGSTATGDAVFIAASAAAARSTLGVGATGDSLFTTATAAAAKIIVDASAPAFSAYANANQAIATSTFTKVQLPLEVFDTANAFDATTNYRFTPLVAGYYQINGQIRCIATNMTSLIVSIYKNGAEYTRGDEQNIAANSVAQQITVSDVVFLNGTTDYVELFGQIIGTSPSFQVVSAAVTSKMSGSLVRAA